MHLFLNTAGHSLYSLFNRCFIVIVVNVAQFFYKLFANLQPRQLLGSRFVAFSCAKTKALRWTAAVPLAEFLTPAQSKGTQNQP